MHVRESPPDPFAEFMKPLRFTPGRFLFCRHNDNATLARVTAAQPPNKTKLSDLGREEGGLPPFPVTVTTTASTDPASVRAAHQARAQLSLSCSMLACAVTDQLRPPRPSCS